MSIKVTLLGVDGYRRWQILKQPVLRHVGKQSAVAAALCRRSPGCVHAYAVFGSSNPFGARGRRPRWFALRLRTAARKLRMCAYWLRLNVPLTVANGQIVFDDAESVSLPRRFYRVIER